MTRTRRRDWRGRQVRDGQWATKCPDGHRCSWCGPGVRHAATVAAQVAAEKVAEAAR